MTFVLDCPIGVCGGAEILLVPALSILERCISECGFYGRKLHEQPSMWMAVESALDGSDLWSTSHDSRDDSVGLGDCFESGQRYVAGGVGVVHFMSHRMNYAHDRDRTKQPFLRSRETGKRIIFVWPDALRESPASTSYTEMFARLDAQIAPSRNSAPVPVCIHSIDHSTRNPLLQTSISTLCDPTPLLLTLEPSIPLLYGKRVHFTSRCGDARFAVPSLISEIG